MQNKGKGSFHHKSFHNKRSIQKGCAGVFAFCLAALVQAQQPQPAPPSSEQLRQMLEQQSQKLEQERKRLAEQEAQLQQTRRNLEDAQRQLNQMRTDAGLPAQPSRPQVTQQPLPPPQPQRPAPVGQAPAPQVADNRPVEIAPIFDQPGVLTPRNKFVLEPSLQYSYSTSNRVALVGYTVIPAILIGVVDVREVKRTTWVGALTARYGVTNRFEVEARIPYVYRSDTSVGRELLQGTSTDSVFDADDHGLGDVELTGRYQFNDGGVDRPFYVGSLRVKTRTGTDPFESKTSTAVAGFRSGVQTELPTGSGFWGVQPALTVLYPSDPAVLFGSVSYLYSFKRNHVKQETDQGDQELGSIQPGGIFGFNFGMGLALNERSSFSIGYDHSSVGKVRQNNHTVPDSVTVQLATLLLGLSYRLDDKHTLNLSVGAGLTVDTPDVTLTLRMPMSF